MEGTADVKRCPANSPNRSVSAEATISAIASELRIAPEVVRFIYDEEIARLQSNSVVKNFIEIIAGRRVKARLAFFFHTQV